MARPSAAGRVNRILAIVPWIASQDAPRLADVCARFGLSEGELLADLAVVPYIGRYPYTPDMLVDVVVDGDRVEIRYGNAFERPLRLTRDEALTLVAAGRALGGRPGHDPDGPLARGLAKLAEVAGVDPGHDIEVVLEESGSEVIDRVRSAQEAREVLRIEYYSHGRGERTEREIEPLRTFHAEGAWYVVAHCRSSDEERVFRVDRITEVATSGEFFEPREVDADHVPFRPDDDAPRVVLEVDGEGRWIIEQYPTEAVEETADGLARVTLAVAGDAWLARVLLQLGPHGRVVEGPPGLAELGPRVARNLLDRYLGDDPGLG